MAACRQHFAKSIPSALLLALLTSSSPPAIDITLRSLQDVVRLLPALFSLPLASALLQLLSSSAHG
jgi:hypothetical protein